MDNASAIIIIAGMAVTLLFVGLVEKRYSKKRFYARVKSGFGKKPEGRQGEFEDIAMYYKELGIDGSIGIVDDATWNDLDMADVFRRMNATSSFAGEQYLYARLRTLSGDHDTFKDYEEKIRYLTEHEEERAFIQYQHMCIGKRASSYYLPLFFQNIDAFAITNQWIYRILQCLLALSFIAAAITGESWVLRSAVVIFLVNIVLCAVVKNKYQIQLEVVKGLYALMRTAEKITGNKSGGYGAAFPELGKILRSVKKSNKYFQLVIGRSNPSSSGDFMEIAATYVTGAFLLDLTSYHKIIRFIIQNKESFLRLYSLMGEMDMLTAVASYRQSLPGYCLPEFKKGLSMKMKGVYHPLLSHPVCNDVDLMKNTIITGSNASGKSTFIKAAALNQIMAQTIHTCTAEKITLPIARVMTSMAVKDNPMDGESYYIKEIKSLKRITDGTDADFPVLCVVDEILRGTNTKERIAASAAILKYLKDKNCIVLVATHDMDLLQLLKDDGYEYYYFTEQPDDEDVLFDYIIRPGVSDKTNAIRLLKRMEFPREIVDGSQDICQSLM